MDRALLSTFVRELVNLGHDMQVSVRRYNETLEALDGSHDVVLAHSAAFVAAQSMLTIGALVSKMLIAPGAKPAWCKCDVPTQEQEKHQRAVARAKALRDALKLKSVPETLLSRKVRNHFEHFDDRLDTYFAGPVQCSMDRVITNQDINALIDSGLVSIGGGHREQSSRVLRQLVRSNATISVLDDSVSLAQLYENVIDVASRAQAWLQGQRVAPCPPSSKTDG